MTAADASTSILLGLSVAAVLICSIGLCAMDSVYDRLHCLGPAALIGPTALLAAVLVRHSSAQAMIKALLISVIIILVSPVLTHATARAARVRDDARIADPSPEGDAS